MITLRQQDQHHLDAAEGWLGLGDWLAADQELDRIGPEIREHPQVLSVRWRVYSTAKKWELAYETARSISERVPEASFGYVHMAAALHQLKRTKEAQELLLAVVDRFPANYMMRYTLAAYSCGLGELKEAWEWLTKAIDLDQGGNLRKMALDDPDLSAFWTELSQI